MTLNIVIACMLAPAGDVFCPAELGSCSVILEAPSGLLLL